MNQLAKIAQIGEPILRNKAKPVTKTIDENILKLIDSLTTVAIASKGVGIAAPQISQPYRLFIIASHPSDRYPNAPTMAPTAMINPRILSHSEQIIQDWEGCLSVPNIRGLVSRYQAVEVEYANKEGKIQQQIFTDFVARIFQHELDHLDGILFVDRIEDNANLYSETEYRQIIASNPRNPSSTGRH